MVELVTVILLLGILAFFALPRFNLLEGYDERGFNDKLLAGIQFARKAAIAKRRYVCVTVADASTVSFTVDPAVPENTAVPFGGACPFATPLQLPVQDSNRGAACAATNVICAPPGVTITAPAAGTSFQFDALGRPSFAAALAINSTGGTAITVEPENGYVHH